MDRRSLLAFITAAAALPWLNACTAWDGDTEEKRTPRALDAFADELAKLEAKAGGRLGFAALNVDTGSMFGHRLDEHFALCSTFKFPLAAIVLNEGRGGRIAIDRPRHFTPEEQKLMWDDTRKALTQNGLSARMMAEIAQKTSDNGCANHLLAMVGGPAGMTRHLRNFGDKITRIDRMEPEMNRVLPGDVQDSTTPRAMAELTGKLIFGQILHADDRTQLMDWTTDTKTGLSRLRKHLPDGWFAGNKTGSGFNEDDPRLTNKCNDVAWIKTADGRRFAIAAYYESPVAAPHARDEDNAVVAEAGRMTFEHLNRYAHP